MPSSNRPMVARYGQGDWFGVVRQGTVVLLGPDTPASLIEAVWSVLASAPEAHEVLHEVTDAFGVSLSRIPPFGIIDAKDGLRVFLRGDLELTVQSTGMPSGSGGEQVSGRDVTTWTERRFSSADAYSLRIVSSTTAGGSPPLLDGSNLPLLEGVVRLSGVDVVLTDGAALETPVQPAEGVAATAVGVPGEADAAEAAAGIPNQPGSEAPDSPAPVSDETVLGYPDADLGLTIAPHALAFGQGEEDAVDEESPAARGDSAGRREGSAYGGPASETSAEDGSGEPTHEPEVASGGAADTPSAVVEGLEQGSGPGEVAGSDQAGGSYQPGGPELSDDSDQPGGPELPDSNQSGPDKPADSGAEPDVSEDSTGVPVHTSTTDPLLPTLETTTNYDHLWDKTVMRNIEDAAVRIADDSDEHDVPAPPAPKTTDLAEPAPTVGEQAAGEPAANGGSGVVPSPAAPAGPAAAPAEPAAAPLGMPALIDSVPWLRSSTGASAPQGGPEAPGLAGPPPAVPASPAPPAQSMPEHDPDHDGQTIMKSSVADDLPTAASAPDQASAPAGNGPSVLARVCSQGHANPPTYPQCAACGVALSGDAVQVPRPRLGRMRLSTGELIDLDQSLIIGRQPSVSRVQGGTMPRLVQVESPGGDISRSHVEVRLEGWHVMLCDLKATNGTVLIREGQAPRRLAQNEMAILLDGDIAELGDNISLRFEEIL
ncbi:hypothetical protein ACIPY3_05545 [Paenarthrobacter sp. NPDC089714]|uniref:FHA domain-containing protein n=1 Tax=Paenarthrobacter sp. NPDC089714 TaxID=3364377 RepID=UPI0038009356